MPRISKLKEIDGAMWARLDMDWDGGPISLYTELEIREIKETERKRIIYAIDHLDRISYYED